MRGRRGQPAHRGTVVSEAEFRRMWFDPTLRVEDIGEKLGGITRQAVTVRAQIRGLGPRPCMRKMAVRRNDKTFARCFLANVNLADMAAHWSCTVQAINKTARRMGLVRNANRHNTITMQDFKEMIASRVMAASATEAKAAMKQAQMVDGVAYRNELARTRQGA